MIFRKPADYLIKQDVPKLERKKDKELLQIELDCVVEENKARWRDVLYCWSVKVFVYKESYYLIDRKIQRMGNTYRATNYCGSLPEIITWIFSSHEISPPACLIPEKACASVHRGNEDTMGVTLTMSLRQKG